MQANQFKQPMSYYGKYKTNTWAGYVFKEILGYTSGRHTGVDYNGAGAGNADKGMRADSIANGTVRYRGNKTNIGFGNTIIIEHELSPTLAKKLGCKSLFSRYMHLDAMSVKLGDKVVMGQKIGTVGNTGTQWAHLHIDLYKSTISHGGVHFQYDKDTQMASYLDVYEFIQANLKPVDVAKIATIPAPKKPAPQPTGKRIAQKGTFTANQPMNIRRVPSTKNNASVGVLLKNQSVKYDSYIDAEGIRWVSYIGFSGKRNYIARRTLNNKTIYGSAK